MSSGRPHPTRELDSTSSGRQAGSPATRRRILEAALRLIGRTHVDEVSLAAVARAARVSRQALYLHFADRAALLMAVVQHADERRGLADGIRRIREAPTGIAALREMAALQARLNPEVWPLARVFDAVRHRDAAAERSWQERLDARLEGCRAIVARLAAEGVLRRGLSQAVAADLLWTITSLHTWEALVVQRGWSAREYERHVTDVLMRTLVRGAVQLQLDRRRSDVAHEWRPTLQGRQRQCRR
jgi:AcrR family transcriptional regulator